MRATTEQIHADIELQAHQVLEAYKKVLNEPDKVKCIRNKVSLLKELGFSKSVSKEEEELLEKEKINNKILDDLITLKEKYPTETFLTFDQIFNICNKYKLDMGNVKDYTKDVPEKNLLEIKNRLMLSNSIDGFLLFIEQQILFGERKFIKNITKYDLKSNKDEIEDSDYNQIKKEIDDFDYTYRVIEKNNLVIIAPKNHFKEMTKHLERKDPVVFDFVTSDVVRIITKWGTKDDKSYLDPLLNE